MKPPNRLGFPKERKGGKGYHIELFIARVLQP